jgi:DNA-binding GntR family transcriptional regulator
VAAITGNERIQAVLSARLDEVRRPHHLLPEARRRTSRVELAAHHRLLGAIREGDSGKAGRVMSGHLTEVTGVLGDAFTNNRR